MLAYPDAMDPRLAALLAGAPPDMPPDFRGMGGAPPTPLGPDSLGVPMYQPPGGPPVFMPQQQTAPTLAPNPWQHRLDAVGMALAQMPQPDPRAGALAQFVSGLGRGYGQGRLRDMLKRQGIEEGLKAKAAQQNALNLWLTRQQMENASKAGQTLQAHRLNLERDRKRIEAENANKPPAPYRPITREEQIAFERDKARATSGIPTRPSGTPRAPLKPSAIQQAAENLRNAGKKTRAQVEAWLAEDPGDPKYLTRREAVNAKYGPTAADGLLGEFK